MASLKSRVLELLQQNTGLTMATESIASELGEEENVASVGSTLSKLNADKKFGVERVSRGMYRFVGANHTKSGDMLEVIHEFESGALLLMHENETIYIAKKMEA